VKEIERAKKRLEARLQALAAEHKNGMMRPSVA
jgi:hypothetical protein